VPAPGQSGYAQRQPEPGVNPELNKREGTFEAFSPRPRYRKDIERDRFEESQDPFYVEALSHDRTDDKELLGALDHGFDLIYHDIKEAMHAEQRHHGFETHSYDLQPHVEDDPLAVG